MKRRNKFDYVLVETIGLAAPVPVAQSFFIGDEICPKDLHEVIASIST
tara:strand:- start:86 stop:229 length:144 start_codon:yes stop_codon:yes gene_type:complete